MGERNRPPPRRRQDRVESLSTVVDLAGYHADIAALRARTAAVGLKYDDYRYLYPPRPRNTRQIKIPHTFLPILEKMGYWAQYKKNGTCNIIAIGPDKTLRCMPRHGPNQPHKRWAPTPASSRLLKRMPGTGWTVVVAELLHSKTRFIKDTNYIHDILVYDGDYLLGTTLAERQALLQAIFLPLTRKHFDELNSHIVLDDNTWLAKNHISGFVKMFDSMEKDEDEGLVLKDPNARLELCTHEKANSHWQIKCLRRIAGPNA